LKRLAGISISSEHLRQIVEGEGQRAALRNPAKRAALSRLRNYVGERTSMIRYAESRTRGWDIGSGPTESLCKSLARRLKGPGMRWGPAGAEALLSLTALQDSNAWDNYWKLQVQQNWSHPATESQGGRARCARPTTGLPRSHRSAVRDPRPRAWGRAAHGV
jgi:hypothetical protein